MAEVLDAPPLGALAAELMAPEEFAAHSDRFAWRRNDVHDTLLTEINYRIGRHRSRPVFSHWNRFHQHLVITGSYDTVF